MLDILIISVLCLSADWLIDTTQNIHGNLYAKKHTETKHEHKDNCKERFCVDCFNKIFIRFDNTFHLQYVQHVSLCTIQKYIRIKVFSCLLLLFLL